MTFQAASATVAQPCHPMLVAPQHAGCWPGRRGHRAGGAVGQHVDVADAAMTPALAGTEPVPGQNSSSSGSVTTPSSKS